MAKSGLKEVGIVTHYYTRISVALVELTNALSIGNRILVLGETTNFEQTVESMQIEHVNIADAKAGQSIGLKVDKKVREGDKIYLRT